jgi:hypothetical protein
MNKILSLLLALLISTNAYAGETEINRLKSVGFGVSQANEIDSIYIDTTNAQILTSPTISGNLTFSTAAAKIIPGATSLTFRNNADSADNLSITDAGAVTFRNNLNFTAAGGTNLLASAGHVRYGTSAGGGNAYIRVDNLDRWYVATSTGALTQDATNGGDIVFGLTAGGTLRTDTADAADSKEIYIAGGGALGITRGGDGRFYGNDDGTYPGSVKFFTGNASSSEWTVNLSGASSLLRIKDSVDADILTITQSTKATALTGILTSSRATDLGWTPVNAANQACNTTCTSACVFGMNTGALGNFVGCADATADTCICAGAS